MNKAIIQKKTLEFARKSDFVFWNGEAWGPEVEAVDWSCDYDQELQNFLVFVVKECAELSNPESRIKILTHFGLSK